jgi:hypothetical protein
MTLVGREPDARPYVEQGVPAATLPLPNGQATAAQSSGVFLWERWATRLRHRLENLLNPLAQGPGALSAKSDHTRERG